MAQPILEASNLVKKYGALTAVNDVSFLIEEGEIFGLLGPNGAGKSTVIAMLTGLFPPDAGAIHILGFDAVQDVDRVKQFIGVAPQDLALYPDLTGRENLRFFGEMYGLSGARLKERVERALEYVAMGERAGDLVKTYSGGMKRRLNLAVGMINEPRILFLDEPTVGVDPQSRIHIFESVEQLNREQHMTIFYTTHYMEEAERLCQRIAIMDHGKVIAQDTPRKLIDRLGGGILQIGLASADETICQQVSGLTHVRAATFLPPDIGDETGLTSPERAILKVEVQQPEPALIEIIQLFNQLNINILSIETLEPNLESLFLHLTGKSLRD